MLQKLLMALFPGTCRAIRLEGRGAGWRACENLALHRARELGDEQYQFVLKLLQ